MNNKEEDKILYNELFDIAKIWQYQLHLEYSNPNRNIRISFKDIGSFGELLAISYNSGYIGTGSGAMGLDLVNKETNKSIEVKSCCTIQNSKCQCGTKFNPLFHDKCPVCNNNGMGIEDSRFTINAKEFLSQYNEGFFDNFTLFHVSQINHNKDNKEIGIHLSLYKIDFSDQETRNIKLDYFKKQAKNGKKPNCNLLPFSFDFFKLCPVLIDSFRIRLNYENMDSKPVIEHENHIAKRLRVPINILRDKEKKAFRKLISYSSKDETVDVIDFTKHIPYRKKTHGKNRGDTRKNVYRSIG
jgi:hypothetical protein